MKKIILTERLSKKIASIISEGNYIQVGKMPVDKKENKPFYIDPEKVKIVKNYLDKGFTPHDFERVGADGYPEKIKIITMNASNGEPLKAMYKEQMKELLIDKFQKMFLDKNERSMFLAQVLDDWLNNSIGVSGILSKNMLNETTVTNSMVDERASETDLSPTEKQKEAGNYKMGHISIKGMRISIENPKGSKRRYGDGEDDYVIMNNHYGYFTNTTGNGKDGDAVDVFIGPNPNNFDKVYVIDQKIDGEFDESKVMLGFLSKEAAKEAYLSNYDENWDGFWKITAVPTHIFKKWLYRGNKQRKPFFDYVAVRKHKLTENSLNEEEYNVVKFIGTAYNNFTAEEIALELNKKGISSYTEGDDIYILIEKDKNAPWYVDDATDIAKEVLNRYSARKSE